jgi:hypothetical protein
MSTLARRFYSVPARTSSETWLAIVDLIAHTAAARDELIAAVGLMSLLIADESTRYRPLVVSGSGPQVRIYTLHGEDAIDKDEANEAPLAVDPTAGPWSLEVPVSDGDSKWVTAQLKKYLHIFVAPPADDAADRAIAARAKSNTVPVVDIRELRKS